MPAYRTNVGAILRCVDGQVLMCRSAGGGEFPWQFPQGGVREGETLEAAMWREVAEELGLRHPRKTCGLIACGPAVRYPFSSPGPDYVGQEQTLFLLDFHGSADDLSLNAGEAPEFTAFRWVSLGRSIQLIVPAKRKVLRRTYRALAEELNESDGGVESRLAGEQREAISPVDLAIYLNLDLTLTEMTVSYPEITDRVFDEAGVPPELRDASAFESLFFDELDAGSRTPWRDAFRRYFAQRGLSLDAERTANRFVELELNAVEPADESLRRTVRKLSDAFSVGVLTRGVGRVQRAKLEKLDLVELLEDIVISRELDASKTDGSLFAAAEERLEADNYVYVSTHEADIRHARNTGWEGKLVESVSCEDIAKLDIVRDALDPD